MTLSRHDRELLIRLAASMPVGSMGRRVILSRVQPSIRNMAVLNPRSPWDWHLDVSIPGAENAARELTTALEKARKELDRILSAPEFVEDPRNERELGQKLVAIYRRVMRPALDTNAAYMDGYFNVEYRAQQALIDTAHNATGWDGLGKYF